MQNTTWKRSVKSEVILIKLLYIVVNYVFCFSKNFQIYFFVYYYEWVNIWIEGYKYK